MENTESEIKDTISINPSDGITLPTGPPLTPQFQMITPTTGAQGAQFTATQLQMLSSTQNGMLHTPSPATVSGANQGVMQQQQVIGTQQHQLMESTTNHLVNQPMGPPVQVLQWNPSNQSQNQNLIQQWAMLQPIVNMDVAPTQTPQIINPFAQLTAKIPETPTSGVPSINPSTNTDNQTMTLTPTRQQSLMTPTSYSQITASGNQQVIDNNNLAAYIAALSAQNQASGPIQLGNLVTLNNGMLLATANYQLTPNPPQGIQIMQTSGSTMVTAAAQGNMAQTPVPGSRAYQLLAVSQTRKQHAIKKDVERMKHLKAMKLKLVGKTFQPLNYRYASNYKTLEALPGWFSNANKEKLCLWGIRGAERFRQTMLLEIEAEMLKVKGRRDVLFHDEQNGGTVFALCSEARNDSRI